MQNELREAKEAALIHCKEALEADQAQHKLELAVQNADVAERNVSRESYNHPNTNTDCNDIGEEGSRCSA